MKGYKLFKYPYILVEDHTGKFQPLYKEYKEEVPYLNLQSPILCCPFSNARRQMKPKKLINHYKTGYCEVCYTKYEDYEAHVNSPEHREYGDDDYNYRGIDLFIKESLEQDLYEMNSYVNSPCERLEEKYSNVQVVNYSSESGHESLIKMSKGSASDFEEAVDFNVILDNIKKAFPNK